MFTLVTSIATVGSYQPEEVNQGFSVSCLLTFIVMPIVIGAIYLYYKKKSGEK